MAREMQMEFRRPVSDRQDATNQHHSSDRTNPHLSRVFLSYLAGRAPLQGAAPGFLSPFSGLVPDS